MNEVAGAVKNIFSWKAIEDVVKNFFSWNTFSDIFSWIILCPVCIIVSGKFLSKRFKFEEKSEQLFKIKISDVLLVQAKGNEVILGLAGFILSLSAIGFFIGKNVHNHFTIQFGFDPGHFNCILIVSSLTTVAWSILIWGTGFIHGHDTVSEEHNILISELSKKKNGGN